MSAVFRGQCRPCSLAVEQLSQPLPAQGLPGGPSSHVGVHWTSQSPQRVPHRRGQWAAVAGEGWPPAGWWEELPAYRSSAAGCSAGLAAAAAAAEPTSSSDRERTTGSGMLQRAQGQAVRTGGVGSLAVTRPGAMPEAQRSGSTGHSPGLFVSPTWKGSWQGSNGVSAGTRSSLANKTCCLCCDSHT